MKIGLFDAAFGHLDLDGFLDFASGIGCNAVEIGTGGYVGAPHCDVDALLSDAGARRAFAGRITERGLSLQALSCHGNPLHPDTALAARHQAEWRKTLQLAEALEVSTVVTFSGLPGGAAGDSAPNWNTCSWPLDHPEALESQWNERALPYWRVEAEVAKAHGVRVAIEMHAGFLVHSPRTALRLIDEIGPAVGVNFDPSHLFVQQIDPARAAHALRGHILHAHAKDTRFDTENMGVIGVLDTHPHDDHKNRAWHFCDVGGGHDRSQWRGIADALEAAGYHGALSIEHEDPRHSAHEGAMHGADFLRRLAR